MKENLNFEIPQLQLKGDYKIQLFDKETNELIKEVEKHNVISKIPFSTAFYNHIYYSFINNTDCFGVDGSNKDNRNWLTGYINWLLLTNDSDTIEDDYKNPVVMGETVGYGYYNDTSTHTDSKFGNFNKNETTIKYNITGLDKKTVTKHIVWDFPTDKANGTFDNLYLVPNPNSNYDSTPDSDRGNDVSFNSFSFSCEGAGTDKIKNDYYSDYGPISSSETHLYMQCLYLRNNTYGTANQKDYIQCWDKIAKFDLKKWTVEYIALSVPSEHANKPAYIYFACGMLWRIEKDYTTTRYSLEGTYKDTIDFKSNFSNSDNLNLYADSNNNYIGNGSYYNSTPSSNRFDIFTGNEDYLFVSYIIKKVEDGKNVYYNYLCVVDKNGAVINEVFLNKTDKGYACSTPCIGYINNIPYIFILPTMGNEKAVFKLENGKLVKKAQNILSRLSSSLVPFFYSRDGILYKAMGRGYTNSISLNTLIPWASHCKLDAPVTKTATNTMKIQYDVTVDYIIPGMISNLK